MIEYVAKFTELSHFSNGCVATDLEKVRKFKDDLRLSIRGKIVVFLLHDIDFMVRKALTIEREMDDARSILATGTSEKREDQPSLVWERGKRLLLLKCFRDEAATIRDKARLGFLVS